MQHVEHQTQDIQASAAFMQLDIHHPTPPIRIIKTGQLVRIDDLCINYYAGEAGIRQVSVQTGHTQLIMLA